MGADEALVVDSEYELDSSATAKALAFAIKAEGDFKIILTGKLAIDDNNSAVSQMVAEYLNIPHVTVVSKMTFQETSVLCEREIEGCTREVIEVQLPALVAANKGLNMPRYASLPGIMKAKKKIIKEVVLAALDVGQKDSKFKFVGFQLPPEKPSVKMLAGDSKAQAEQLASLLRNEAKVI